MTSSGLRVMIVTCIFFCFVKTASVTFPLTKIAIALYNAYCQPNKIPAANKITMLKKIDIEPIVFPVRLRMAMLTKSSPPEERPFFKA